MQRPAHQPGAVFIGQPLTDPHERGLVVGPRQSTLRETRSAAGTGSLDRIADVPHVFVG